MTKKPKPKPQGYVFGRPKNEKPTEKVAIRWPKPVADYFRGHKWEVVDIIEQIIKKGSVKK